MIYVAVVVVVLAAAAYLWLRNSKAARNAAEAVITIGETQAKADIGKASTAVSDLVKKV